MRYKPQANAEQTAASVIPPQIAKYLNLRCQCVRDLHMSVGVNIFRLVRAHTSAMLVSSLYLPFPPLS